MKKVIHVLAAGVVLLACAASGPAQVTKESARGTADLRVGSLWEHGNTLSELNYTRFSIGARISPYLGQSRVTHRLSVQFAVDYVPVSTTDYFDPILNSKAQISEHLVVLNPGLGFDVLQRPQADITLRYGGAVFGNLTLLELPSLYGGWEDVCDLSAFSGACPSRWNFLGNAGVSVRYFPTKHHSFYFGADHTRYAGRKNQLVGTFGGYF